MRATQFIKGLAEGYQFKGPFPFDVDHMHGGRGINLPKAETKKYFTDKKQWQRAVDDINSSKYDDNSDYIGVTGRSTVEINGREWARWSDAQQKGYIELSSMSEQGVAEADINAVDINQVAGQMKFLPTTKQAKQYKFVKDGVPGQMLPMTYTVATQQQPVVTVTSDGKETQNIAATNDIIMSGPSKENYVVKAAKFPKLYQGTLGGTVVPEQSPRLVALYTGKTPVTFTAPWGESMILKPGDYLVKDGDAGYYRVAKIEYKQTYNEPGQKGVAEGGEGSGRHTPDSWDTTPGKVGRVEKTAQGIRHHADSSRYGGTEPDVDLDRLDKGAVNTMDKALGVKWDRESKKYFSPIKVDEVNNEKIGGRYDADDFDDMVSRLKKLAGAGPMRTVYDPDRRVYRNMPTAQQPKKAPR